MSIAINRGAAVASIMLVTASGCTPETSPRPTATETIEQPSLSPYEQALKEHTLTLSKDLGAVALPAITGNYISSCFDLPLEKETLSSDYPSDPSDTAAKARYEAIRDAEFANPDPIDLPFINGKVTSMPDVANSPDLHSGIVKIVDKSDKSHGSGFAIDDAHGNQVIVTAAHVAAEMKAKNLRVINTAGNTTTIDAGCYVYGDHETLMDPKTVNEGSQNFDIAILSLKKSLNLQSLPLSSTNGPERGQWMRFTNFGADAPPDKPRDFYGVTADGQPYDYVTVISDICAFPADRAAEEYATCGFVGGGSGSVVTDTSGEVQGIAVSGMNYSDYFEDAEGLKNRFNMSFPGAPYGFESGFTPDDTSVVPVRTIKDVLNKLSR